MITQSVQIRNNAMSINPYLLRISMSQHFLLAAFIATRKCSYSAPYICGERAPRPLGEVMRELRGQYLRVLTRPSAETFATELGKAVWRSIRVQLLGWGIITAILGFIAWLTLPITLNILNAFPGLRPEADLALLSRLPYGGQIVGVPLGFFTWMGLLYLIAKVINGQGMFLGQSYASVLFLVLLGVISSMLAVIPYLGWLNVEVFIYGIVLQVYAVRDITNFVTEIFAAEV
jgi:hypothetical protein